MSDSVRARFAARRQGMSTSVYLNYELRKALDRYRDIEVGPVCQAALWAEIRKRENGKVKAR